MLRRLHPDQPESFAFTPANREWAATQIAKYPEGRQASAIIPLLWRAQEQEGWLSRPAIETVADMLDLAHIRALEVATFYFMFQLQPVGSVAHVQVCGTTSCMICGAEDLVAVCKEKIAPNPHEISADGKFSWEEVECLGACSNAPMAQIGKDYYEDLTVESFTGLLDRMAAGDVPVPGPQNGRYASEPKGGLTSLQPDGSDIPPLNVSATLATDWGDTLKRIDGSEVPASLGGAVAPVTAPDPGPTPVSPVTETADADAGRPKLYDVPPDPIDDLKKINGIGPKLEEALNGIGVYTFAQIASWDDAAVAWIDNNLVSFKGRITRDEWVAQAIALTAGTQEGEA